MIIAGFADFIAGLAHLGDARQLLRDLRERFARFALEVDPGQTRLRRITISERMRARLKAVKDQLRQRRHEPASE